MGRSQYRASMQIEIVYSSFGLLATLTFNDDILDISLRIISIFLYKYTNQYESNLHMITLSREPIFSPNTIEPIGKLVMFLLLNIT